LVVFTMFFTTILPAALSWAAPVILLIVIVCGKLY
jgi:hypothetical protein